MIPIFYIKRADLAIIEGNNANVVHSSSLLTQKATITKQLKQKALPRCHVVALVVPVRNGLNFKQCIFHEEVAICTEICVSDDRVELKVR